MITGYFDGACQPINPGGKMSYGIVIYKDQFKVLEKGEVIDSPDDHKNSNNFAEYTGFLTLLGVLIDKGWENEKIIIRGDSKLVINQMFEDWNINAGLYVPVAMAAKELLKKFPHIEGKWLGRGENNIADELSEQALILAGVEIRIKPRI